MEKTVVGELSALLGPEAVVTEPHERARYEQGWRYGRGTALAAVRPSSTEEVSRVLAFAAARGIRVVPQGANTGLVGASTPDATGSMLVLSLERLSRILSIDAVDRTLDVREHDRPVESQPEEQPLAGRRRRIDRLDLARRLLAAAERCHVAGQTRQVPSALPVHGRDRADSEA